MDLLTLSDSCHHHGNYTDVGFENQPPAAWNEALRGCLRISRQQHRTKRWGSTETIMLGELELAAIVGPLSGWVPVFLPATATALVAGVGVRLGPGRAFWLAMRSRFGSVP